ncbi:hypothetical protein KBY93_10655 [Synechococcus sp. J7-Johnson]|uniref:hypothetical protein n=1 Tax=Synechococcus sp. J7-Johnson TaxID=2823737 RepID=UPI0020CC3492|nr:hypothetical protein [Synechococcus sp. J7-Johnson]MCP9841090.1 hypothetical protein [Synechococcus sp. J7-Johnson]
MKTHLPDPGRKIPLPRKVFSRQRRSGSAWREGGLALLNGAAGTGLLLLLMQLPNRLDSLLVISKVISALIRGLSQIGMGLISLLLGLLQAFGVLLLLGLAIAALLLLINGAFRLLRLAMPGLGGVMALPAGLARVVWSVVRIRPPDRPER